MRRKGINLAELKGNELLTSYQVAKTLGVDPSSVGLWVSSGKLMGFRTPGGHLRIKASELKKFCEASGMDSEENSISVSSYAAADMLGVSSSSIVTWIKNSMLESWKTPGGHNRIRLSELRKFAEKFKMHLNEAGLKEAPKENTIAVQSHSQSEVSVKL